MSDLAFAALFSSTPPVQAACGEPPSALQQTPEFTPLLLDLLPQAPLDRPAGLWEPGIEDDRKPGPAAPLILVTMAFLEPAPQPAEMPEAVAGHPQPPVQEGLARVAPSPAPENVCMTPEDGIRHAGPVAPPLRPSPEPLAFGPEAPALEAHQPRADDRAPLVFAARLMPQTQPPGLEPAPQSASPALVSREAPLQPADHRGAAPQAQPLVFAARPMPQTQPAGIEPAPQSASPALASQEAPLQPAGQRGAAPQAQPLVFAARPVPEPQAAGFRHPAPSASAAPGSPEAALPLADEAAAARHSQPQTARHAVQRPAEPDAGGEASLASSIRPSPERRSAGEPAQLRPAARSIILPGPHLESGATRPESCAPDRSPQPQTGRAVREPEIPRADAGPPEISLRVSARSHPGRPSESVAVRLIERAGQIHVSVRSADSGLADSLRQELPVLVTRLERGGFRTEIWHPADAAGPSLQPSDPVRQAEGDQGWHFQRHPGRQGDPDADREQRQPQPPPAAWQEVLNSTAGPGLQVFRRIQHDYVR